VEAGALLTQTIIIVEMSSNWTSGSLCHNLRDSKLKAISTNLKGIPFKCVSTKP
jgi:hypothetical protein